MAIRRFLPRSDDRVMARDASQHEGRSLSRTFSATPTGGMLRSRADSCGGECTLQHTRNPTSLCLPAHALFTE